MQYTVITNMIKNKTTIKRVSTEIHIKQNNKM